MEQQSNYFGHKMFSTTFSLPAITHYSPPVKQIMLQQWRPLPVVALTLSRSTFLHQGENISQTQNM